MAITAVPSYKTSLATQQANARKAERLGYINPYRPPVFKAPVAKAPATVGVAAPGAPQAAAAPTGLAPVKTDYQTAIGKLLSGLGAGGLQNYVPPTEYQGEISADPEYQLGLRNLTNTQNTLAQGRANAFRQGLISSGFAPGAFQAALARDPSLAQFSGDIDQGAIDAAAANQMSTKAQLDRSLTDAQAAIPYQLAARGVARSGAAATRSSQLQRSYDEQSSQALSSLLDTLRGTAGDYNSGLVNAANQWESTKAAVANRLAQTRGYSQETPGYDLESVISGLSGMLNPASAAPAAARPAAARPVVNNLATQQANARKAERLGYINPYRPPVFKAPAKKKG